jgi:hypothetical protein
MSVLTPKAVLENIHQKLQEVSEALSGVPSGDNDVEWNKFYKLQGHVNDGMELMTEMLDELAKEKA